MKGKGSLALMEQIVMLLVFALASALCLQAFVKSDQLSRRSEAADHAAALCQSVAETIRHNGGVDETREGETHGGLDELGSVCVIPTSGNMMLFYNADWEWVEAPPVGENTAWALPTAAEYYLTIEEQPSDLPGLGKATVQARAADWNEAIGEEKTLFALEVSWQEEVTAHG